MASDSHTDLKVTISPLTRFNWEETLDLELHDYQEDFLPPVLHSLAQSRFENLNPFGIFLDGKMVGYAMYGLFSGIGWVSRIMVDKHFQEHGIGKKALLLLIEHLKNHPQCREIRTSFSRQNALAEYFFGAAGFRRINQELEDEIVMRYR